MIKKIILGTLLSAAAFASNTAELNVNNTDLEVGFQMEIPSQFVEDGMTSKGNYLGVKFIKSEGENSSAPTGHDLGYYGEVNFQTMQNIGTTGIRGGVGVKLNYTEDFMTLPLGVEVGYTVPSLEGIKVGLKGSIYYAPSVLSFDNADSYAEYKVGFEIEPIKDVAIIVGYRKMDTNYETTSTAGALSGDFTYNESAYVGVRMNF